MDLGFKTDKSSENKVKSDINGMKDFAKKALGVIAVGVSIVKINALMDEFGAINGQVSKLNDGLMNTEEAAEMMKNAANDCYMNYADMVSAVTSVKAAAKDIFTSNQEAATFVELTTKAFKSARASETEVTALQQSMNKSFTQGSMQLDTLNSMLKVAPESVKYLTNAFDVSEETLVKMCKNGQISARQMTDAFVQSADDINKNFEDVNLKIMDGLKVIRNDFGKFVSDLNDSTKVTTRVTRMMLDGWKTVSNGLNAIRPTLEKVINFVLRVGETLVSWFTKAGEFIGKVAEKLGGVENMLKIVAIAAAAFFLVMNFQKIVSGIKIVIKALGGFNPKIMLIVAVITLLVLLIEDFINFMQGNDSLMGEIFASMGINAEEIRDKIKNAWNTVKNFLLNLWNFIVELAVTVVGKLKDFWAENGDSILAVLKSAWNKIKSILSGVWKALVSLATTIGNALSDFWAENGALIMETLSNIWNSISSLLSTLWNIISTVAMSVFNALHAFWDEWGETIMAVFSVLWETLISLIQPFLTFLEGLITFLNGVFSGDWAQAWEGIKTMVKGAADFIKNIITGLRDAIKLLFGQIVNSAVTWGKDFIDGLVNGIKNGIGKVKDAVTGVADAIKSVLHFSVPDEGPLTDYETWMPDFADGLAKTLRANKGKVANAAMDIADALKIKPTYQTAVNAQGINKAGNTVNQNVEISNKYEVTERSMAGKASKAMNAATTDITKKLAQGLAYGRG